MAVDYGMKAKTLKLRDNYEPDGIPEALITKYRGREGARSSVRRITIDLSTSDPPSDQQDSSPQSKHHVVS